MGSSTTQEQTQQDVKQGFFEFFSIEKRETTKAVIEAQTYYHEDLTQNSSKN
ncbi:hypothetical protein N8608_00585 [bacterium]|nr:hypothetical protein [bacterium]